MSSRRAHDTGVRARGAWCGRAGWPEPWAALWFALAAGGVQAQAPTATPPTQASQHKAQVGPEAQPAQARPPKPEPKPQPQPKPKPKPKPKPPQPQPELPRTAQSRASSSPRAQQQPRPKPEPKTTSAGHTPTPGSAGRAGPRPVRPPTPAKRPPQAAPGDEDEAVMRDMELYMLMEMLKDYELFYEDP